MNPMLPDWQLPPGTDRGLWDYLHNDLMIQGYDAQLANTPLLKVDLAFAEEHFVKPGRLIDLGCGTGRLLIPFAKRGFDCVGVDLSEAMLAQVRKKAERERVTIQTVQANLVDLSAIADNQFDYAACLFSTLGMIRGVVHRRSFLDQTHRILKEKGILVLHVHNRFFRFGRGLGKRGAEKGDRTMPQAYGGAPLTLHHFSRSEIESELRRAGFQVMEVQPISLSADGTLRAKWFLKPVRAYGFLIACEKK